jgi:hypothetical protein
MAADEFGTDPLLGLQLTAFREQYPKAYIERVYDIDGTGDTSITIFTEHGAATRLARWRIKGRDISDVNAALSRCLTEMGFSRVSEEIIKTARQEEVAAAMQGVMQRETERLASEFKVGCEGLDTRAKAVEASAAKALSKMHKEAAQAIRSEVAAQFAQFDRPKGFWQTFFERRWPAKNAPAPQASDGRVRMTYDEWMRIEHELNAPLDPKVAPKPEEIHEQPLSIG